MSLSSMLQILAGVGILIYGIVIMGESLQIIAGDSLRKLIGSLTGTPLKGLLVGSVVTSILQSSSATTIMVVSFVDVGFMTLVQAIGVILGANIGTTITAQLIAFKITNVAYLCAVIGAALCLLAKRKRYRQMGIGLIGFGLLFIGIEMMATPMAYLKSQPEIMEAFGHSKAMAFFTGLIVTMMVQSSAATVGLTMVVAAQGIIPLDTAIVIVLGENIGTTITCVLASLGARRCAKQAAAAHVLLKVLGAMLILILLPWYTSLIRDTSSDISRQIANAHTLFNVIISFLMLPFVSQYAAFIQKIIPCEGQEEVVGAKYLNPVLITASRAAAVDAVRKEMIRLGEMALGMIKNCKDVFITGDERLVDETLRMESNINDLTREIIRYTAEVGQTGLAADLSYLLNSCTGGVGDIERMGDHGENLIEMFQYLNDHHLNFSSTALRECTEMFDLVILAITKSIKALEKENVKLAEEVVVLEKQIDRMEKTLRTRHIERLNAGSCLPGAGVVFIDILSNLERVGDHANNLAMVVFDIDRMHNKKKS